VSSNAVCILIGSGVYVSAALQQDAGAAGRVELGANMQSGHAPAGCEGAQGVQFHWQAFACPGQESAKLDIVIEENCFEKRVACRGTPA